MSLTRTVPDEELVKRTEGRRKKEVNRCGASHY